MAERISPESPAFKNRWFRLRRGFIPWFSLKPNPYRKAFLSRYEWVSEYSNDARVLDVPCGMGWGTSLINNAKSLIGVDIATDAVAEANDRYGNRASFQVGSMADLQFPDQSFDLVACLEGIEHVDQEIGQQFIRESHRVLSDGGRLLISSPHTESGEHSGNPFHVYEYPRAELIEKLEQSYTIESSKAKKVDNLVVDYFVCRK